MDAPPAAGRQPWVSLPGPNACRYAPAHWPHRAEVQVIAKTISVTEARLADFGCDLARCTRIEAEIRGDTQGKLEGCRVVVAINRRGQHTGPDIRGDRIEIVGRREAPAIGPGLEKAVIAEMVVRVGDENVEDDAAPELPHVCLCGGSLLAQRVHDFEIAPRPAIARIDHAESGKEWNPNRSCPLKAAQQQDWLFSRDLQPPFGNGDACLRGERDRFPQHGVGLIVLVEKLDKCEVAVAVGYGSLGSRAAESRRGSSISGGIRVASCSARKGPPSAPNSGFFGDA